VSRIGISIRLATSEALAAHEAAWRHAADPRYLPLAVRNAFVAHDVALLAALKKLCMEQPLYPSFA
jgi:hypothetical protein